MYEIYTDGSCLGNPGRGGWAAISKDFKICGSQSNSTNNVMEMTAIIKALEQCIWMEENNVRIICLLYTSPSPRDYAASRMPSSA